MIGDRLPFTIETEGELDELLSKPTPETIRTVQELQGDILILGVGGKIGPTLARLVKRAIDEAGTDKRVIGVSRFSAHGVRDSLDKIGVETISCDLLEEEAYDKIPNVLNVIYMTGKKFGTNEDKPSTWAVNTYAPALAAERFKNSRIVVFSTGNVYPFVHINSGGATESTPPEPVGEYAQSCLGRERIFEYFCHRYGTKAVFLRLNYAIDLRYGVLLDVAQKVYRGIPIGMRMGYFNVIWQGDVNNIAVQSLKICENPPNILNVTGPEIISLEWLANKFGRIFGREPIFEKEHMDTALFSDASKCQRIFGHLSVTLDDMIRWVAHWVQIDGETLNKPTHFEVRNGRY